jgi:hypothetical protein
VTNIVPAMEPVIERREHIIVMITVLIGGVLQWNPPLNGGSTCFV